MLNKKICFVIPYFGNFTPYFQLTLNSMGTNSDIDWLIFTDNRKEYCYPQNVKVNYMEFSELQELVQSKFDFTISLKTPYKLCDFKPAYGYVFSEYLKGCDYWGHCDIDVIFGRIRKFLTPEILGGGYDKIFELGHMTLYRNTEENNKRFMLTIGGTQRYKAVFRDSNNQIFDEGNKDSVCTLWAQYGFSVWKEHYCADIAQKSCFFNTVDLDTKYYKYIVNKRLHQIFWWDNGRLILSYMDNDIYREEEKLYIHLMRRTKNMKVRLNPLTCTLYKIIPHEFDELDEKINAGNYKKIKWWTFNLHYFEIRYLNLKSKIRKKFVKKQQQYKSLNNKM